MGARAMAVCLSLMWTTVVCGAVTTARAQVSVQVTLRDTGIEPSSITATYNQPVHLTVVNAGTRTHNLVIPDFYIFTPNLAPGERTTATFTPDKRGSFPYYSDTGGRPEPGLRGTITVR
ncbi:cupredoxin domain-containing protein [Alicyclobacillus sp.]|uniref:cupredoxin domain-containing protein n=1 Tax=Alicyclobacillus sp. TaxID=61169 RepID=UPI0025C64682|nr:cupredoxin domain-containing protein [Alicyclobacillus sp.]MCL6515485.1 cupredoxin domain-containing protein [Alicyclobacillus sp.]